jgi:hypothetical protein
MAGISVRKCDTRLQATTGWVLQAAGPVGVNPWLALWLVGGAGSHVVTPVVNHNNGKSDQICQILHVLRVWQASSM